MKTILALLALLSISAFAGNIRSPNNVPPWVELAELTATDAMAGGLGSSIAMSGDTVVVGAPDATIGSNQAQGAAYVFVKPATGWEDSTQTAKLTQSDAGEFDEFGVSVSISGDTIVVGAEFRSEVYVFVKPAGGWTDMTETAKLTAAGDGKNPFFGTAVSVVDNTVVVGASNAKGGQGAIYVFVRPAYGWQTTAKFDAELYASDRRYSDQFGGSVAFSGNTIVVGARAATIDANNSQGAAYIFVEPASGWQTGTETAKLIASNGARGNLFGQSVAISGSTVVVGATITGYRGGKGAAYVFVEPAGGWTNMTETAELKASDGVPTDYFASFLAIRSGVIVVGAPLATIDGNSRQGAAYVFAKPLTGWRTTSSFNTKITLATGIAGDAFGGAFSLVGNTLVVGATGTNSGTGAAYVFGP